VRFLRVAIGPLAAIALLALLVLRGVETLPYQFGMDFYQIWGVPVAHRIVGESPYVQAPAYAQALNGIADASNEASLKRANALYRDSLVPMATPLLDASYTWLPQDYDTARLTHLATLYAATAAAVFLLARLLAVGPWLSLVIAFLVELTFNPFAQDLRVGNVNSLQLLAIAAILWLATRASPQRRWIVLPALVVFACFKPNTAWIAVALALQFALVSSRKEIIRGVVGAVVAGILVYAGTAWFFSDASVWLMWLHSPHGMNSGVLPASFIPGNRSLPLYLSLHSTAFGVAGYSVICAAAVVGLLALATRGAGGVWRITTVARQCLSDPWFAASLGIAMTYAASPMVWPHYHLFVLVPVMWIVDHEREMRIPAACAALCYVLLSTPFIALLAGWNAFNLLDMLTMVAWMLILPGLVARVLTVARRAPA
jgi:hypothetical protein